MTCVISSVDRLNPWNHYRVTVVIGEEKFEGTATSKASAEELRYRWEEKLYSAHLKNAPTGAA